MGVKVLKKCIYCLNFGREKAKKPHVVQQGGETHKNKRRHKSKKQRSCVSCSWELFSHEQTTCKEELKHEKNKKAGVFSVNVSAAVQHVYAAGQRAGAAAR